MRDELDYEELKGFRRWRVLWRRRWEEQLQTNGLLRHFVHEPAFLVAVLGLLVCGGGVALMIPKVWDPAPPQFSKTVRISLLDYMQAWNLRRTALKARSEGRWEESLVAWRTALANNFADPGLHRGALETLRDAPTVQSRNLNLLLFSSGLLLELSGTNRVESGLVADVLVRHRLGEVALDVLRPWEGELTPTEEAIWLRALLIAGKVSRFESEWQRVGARHADDPRMRLYRAAVDASGPPARAVEALERLRSALTDPGLRLEAARLLCGAALRREDLVDFERGMAVLRELDSAMVQDEVSYWALLARQDRREDALVKAQAYAGVPPPTPMEAVQLVRAWSELGLGDRAVAMLREHAGLYGVNFEVWAAYFDLLMERRQWDELRRVAALVRGNASGKDEVMGIAWYAEAMADLAEDRRTSARRYLQRMKESPMGNAKIVLRLASGLIQAGEFETSDELLKRVESELASQPEYWLQAIMNAQGRRDVEAMQRATDRLLEVQPGSLVGLNMKLGLMLLKRTAPAEALTLSLRLMGGTSTLPGAVINHAAALLQNARTAEAGVVLARLDPARLGPVEKAAWQLAQVEFLGQSEREREALDLGKSIDRSQLMPSDQAWMDTYLETCRRRVQDAKP